MGMTLSWRGINIEVPNTNKRYEEKRINLVSDACGSITDGLLAVMGPSGCGKTSLLNALAGRVVNNSITTGEVLYNGKERVPGEWMKFTGFVDHVDSIYENLTAYEMVMYAAKFKPANKKVNIHGKIIHLFKKLGINHVKDKKMENLFGGERKRVMICTELIRDPKVLILDEPTSGLDNNTSHKLVQLLKSIAEEGTMVIFSIQQPDEITVESVDKILLLSHGRSVYMGDFVDCKNYLEKKGFKKYPKESFSNFAMRILDIESGVYHDSEQASTLNGLVSDVKNTYDFDSFEKIPSKKAKYFVDYSLDLTHISVIYTRRIKMKLFAFATITRLFFLCISLGVAAWISKNKYRVAIAKAISSAMGGSNQTGTLKNAEFHELEACRIIFSAALLPFIASFITTIASTSFMDDRNQVKKEIGQRLYSATSLFVAVYLYEATLTFAPFLIFLGIIHFYALSGHSKFIDFIPSICAYFISLTMYLGNGCLFTDKKFLAVSSCATTMFNLVPWNVVIMLAKYHGYIDMRSKWTIMTNLAASTIVANIFLQKTLLNYLRILKGDIFEALQSHLGTSSSHKVIISSAKLYDSIYETIHYNITGYPFNMLVAVGILVAIVAVYISIAILGLTRKYKTVMRFRLNGRK